MINSRSIVPIVTPVASKKRKTESITGHNLKLFTEDGHPEAAMERWLRTGHGLSEPTIEELDIRNNLVFQASESFKSQNLHLFHESSF